MATNSAKFKRQLNNFVNLAFAREKMLFRRISNHVQKSILDGSPITGAPGQPIQSGDLYRSWKSLGSYEQRQIYFISELFYAPIIEDNFRGAQLRSHTGGFHSVKLTKAAFRRIVAYELEIVKRAIPDASGVGSGMRDPATGRFV